MWKKQDDTVGAAQTEFASKQMPASSLESDGAALIKAFRNHQAEKGKYKFDRQKFFTEGHQPSLPATMATYTEAVNEFTKHPTAFIEQIPLLTKARDAYEQAMRASAELRKVLDADGENLRTFMTQLEQVVKGGKPAPDKKKPEPVKVEAIRETDESTGGVKTFP
jgi:hypothetical protein